MKRRYSKKSIKELRNLSQNVAMKGLFELVILGALMGYTNKFRLPRKLKKLLKRNKDGE